VLPALRGITVLATFLAALLAALPAREAAALEEAPAAHENGAEADVAGLIAAVRAAGTEERPYLLHRLSRVGAEALDATRAARDAAPDAELRAAFERAARWQLALKVSPRLRAGIESQLTFDGQYDDLKAEGPEVVDALLALVSDESTEPEVRLAACRGLADTASPAAAAKIRELYHDILLPPLLREEVGLLLAIFGDTAAVLRDIERLKKLPTGDLAELEKEIERRRTGRLLVEVLQKNRELANLYYRIRSYENAVSAYEKIIKALDLLYDWQKRQGAGESDLAELEKEIALHYYNAACSNALKGDIARAQDLLKEAVRRHAIHYDNIEKDGDLAPLRAHEGYAEFQKALEDLFKKQEL
jgi:tetratricopeptide (TPR) repeat protein